VNDHGRSSNGCCGPTAYHTNLLFAAMMGRRPDPFAPVLRRAAVLATLPLIGGVEHMRSGLPCPPDSHRENLHRYRQLCLRRALHRNVFAL